MNNWFSEKILGRRKAQVVPAKSKVDTFWTYLRRAIFIIIGAFIVAVALEMFLLPSKIIDGGVIGISMLATYLTGGNLGLFIFGINVPFVLFAYKSLGRKFVINTFFAILMLSIATNILTKLKPVTNDLLLVTIFGGILLGLGVGLILRSNASLDGTEMLSLSISKKIKIFSVGGLLMTMNMFIYTAAGFILTWERALYSILTYYIASKVIDTVMEGLDKSKSVRIVSDSYRDIGEAIIRELDTSVTYMKTLGGYSRQEKILTYCVVNRLDMPKLKDLVHEIDPKAFLVTEDVHEVEGVRVKKNK